MMMTLWHNTCPGLKMNRGKTHKRYFFVMEIESKQILLDFDIIDDFVVKQSHEKLCRMR